MNSVLDRQWEWIRDLDYVSPGWARQEFDLRDRAVEIQQNLSTHGQFGEIRLMLPAMHRSVTFRSGDTVVPDSMLFNDMRIPIMRVGGEEETLLIEECLRRAYAGIGW